MYPEIIAEKIKEMRLKEFVGKALDKVASISGKLDALAGMPIIGGTITDIQDIIYMLNDYYRGEYKKMPLSVILGCLAIIAYLACPADLIPDSIPIIGVIDDALVINIVVELCIENELKNYRKWREENNSAAED